MISMFKSLAILTAVVGGAFLTQTAKADHVSIGLGVTVVPARVYAPRVYVAPPVTTVYASPSYSYSYSSTSYYAPSTSYSTTYYSPSYYAPTYVAPPVVYSSPIVVSAPVYCPPPVYVQPFISSRLFLPLPGLSINLGFGGGHSGGGIHVGRGGRR